jgi:hypothetical protein
VTFVPQDGARPLLRYRAALVALHETGWDTPPFFMSPRERAATKLATVFLAGPWSAAEMIRRACQVWGLRMRKLRPLAGRLVQQLGESPPRADVATLAEHIGNDVLFERTWSLLDQLPMRRLYWVHEEMAPAAGAPAAWNVPRLTSTGELAGWLGLEIGELSWLAGCRGGARGAPLGPLHHYSYRWLTSRRGKIRLLEMPKAHLKAIQRRLLHELLDRIPPHEAAHGFRRGRSVATYVAPHSGRAVVLHLDLRQFFPSIPASRVHAVFRTAGYPAGVARLLTGLCTNAVPSEILRAGPAGGEDRQLFGPHLPQGAPTSPALANLCAYHLDCRLAVLARSVRATYTRYADDLVFSGEEVLEGCLRRFHVQVCRIALEEGFEVNTRKSHFMRQGVRQQVAGVVLNVRPNVRRADYDRLKAVLTNCARHGPRAQNRDGRADFRSFLAGRIAYVAMINPLRGRRLWELFERVAWEV